MDPTYAEMLRELGIEVSDDEVLGEVLSGGDAEMAVEAAVEEEERPKMIPGFQHMQHMYRERDYVPYRRVSHFVQMLDQTQGFPSGDREIGRDVLRLLRRKRVDPKHRMAYFRARRILKENGYSSPEYRRIFWALREMGGPVPSVDGSLIVRMQKDFEGLSKAFDVWRARKTGRKNFPSYYLIVQLMFKKYGVKSFYELPSIKDRKKFDKLMSMYRELR